jgi:hypothetical protein
MIDLESIFGDGAAADDVATIAAVAIENATAMIAPEATATANVAATEADVDLLVRFAWWVQRPDVTGKLGWEAPDLREDDRWWARCSFDDLPEPSAAWGRGHGGGLGPGNRVPCVQGGSVDGP